MQKPRENLDITRRVKEEISETEMVQIKQALLAGNFDGVIITNLVNREQYLQVVQGDATAYPGYYGRFNRYYGYYYPISWEPDRLEAGVRYSFESNLYDLRMTEGNNLSWIGRFKVTNPDEIGKSIDKYANELVEVLVKEAIQTAQ